MREAARSSSRRLGPSWPASLEPRPSRFTFPLAVNGAREVLVHEGAVGPLPELGDAAQGGGAPPPIRRRRDRRQGLLGPRPTPRVCSPTASRCAGRRREATSSRAARSAGSGTGVLREQTAWVGLRFEPDGADPSRVSGRGSPPTTTRYATRAVGRDSSRSPPPSRITRAASRGSCSTRSPSCRSGRPSRRLWRRRSFTSRRSLDPPPCCSSGLTTSAGSTIARR